MRMQGRGMGEETNGNEKRTRLDRRVHQPAILLPLHTHATGVLPIPRVGLVHLVQRPEPQSIRRVRDVLAQRPPHALRSRDAPLAPPARPLRIDVYGVDARPPRVEKESRRVPVAAAVCGQPRQYSEEKREQTYFLYGVISVTVFESSVPCPGRNCCKEGDAGPAVGSSKSRSSPSSSSESSTCSRIAPRVPVFGSGLAGKGRSVSSSNSSSTTATRRDIL